MTYRPIGDATSRCVNPRDLDDIGRVRVVCTLIVRIRHEDSAREREGYNYTAMTMAPIDGLQPRPSPNILAS